MTLEQIKYNISIGKKMHWSNIGYEVIRDNVGQYLIKCTSNGSCIGLTWADEVTLNGREDDFFIKDYLTSGYDYIVSTIKVQKRLTDKDSLYGDGTRFGRDRKMFDALYSQFENILSNNNIEGINNN